jgi:hypothetical protein
MSYILPAYPYRVAHDDLTANYFSVHKQINEEYLAEKYKIDVRRTAEKAGFEAKLKDVNNKYKEKTINPDEYEQTMKKMKSEILAINEKYDKLYATLNETLYKKTTNSHESYIKRQHFLKQLKKEEHARVLEHARAAARSSAARSSAARSSAARSSAAPASAAPASAAPASALRSGAARASAARPAPVIQTKYRDIPYDVVTTHPLSSRRFYRKK